MHDFYICRNDGEINECCSPYGNEFYTITKEDIAALLAGKTITASVNDDEYQIFIRLGV